MKLPFRFDVKISSVIKVLVLADLYFFGGWAFIQPIFAIFLVEKIHGATVATAGFVAALYWIVKSVLQVPIANFLDKTPGERDDFFSLLFSLLLGAISAFLFASAATLSVVFLAQALYAVAMAMYIPSWYSIFSRHIDAQRVSFNWSVDSVSIGIASFVASLASGMLAQWVGFRAVFMLAGVLSVASAVVVYFIPNVVFPRPKTAFALRLHPWRHQKDVKK